MDKALLTRATSKDDTPTPGYLYGEIARMTQHSYDTCTKVMEFLISRVKNKHHNIKYKALQVIKHVSRDGRVDFKREMQKHIPTIKECLQFRGPPDPLKGDEYYRRVRDAAKECLDAIYDTDNAPGLGNMGMSARIQGVGNPADAAASGSGWGAKLPWGKGGNANEPPPSNIGNLPGYNNGQGGAGGAGGFGGYGGDANAGGYGGPQYGGPAAPGGYGGPSPGYAAPNAGYGGPQAPAYGQPAPYSDTPGGYGAPPGPGGYGGGPSQFGIGGPPPMNEQKIAGFGNPMYQDPRDEKSGFFKGLKEKAASKFQKPDPRPTTSFSGAPPGLANAPDGWSFATNRGPTSGSYGVSAGSYNPNETYQPGGGYSGGASYAANDQHQHQMSQLKEKAYDGDRKKGRVGGAWTLEQASAATPPPAPAPAQGRESRMQSFAGESRHRSSSNSSGQYGYQPQPAAPPLGIAPPLAPAAAVRATGQTTGAQSDGSYERNLVTALCAPGGMRAIPPKDKLDAFIKSALTLDAEVVGPMLEDCLADAQWTVVSKALATIDALVKADGCEEYADYFTENVSEIESCAKSDKAAVRDRAVKILNALGQSVSAPAPSGAPRASRSKPAPSRSSEPDLLGFGDDEPSDAGASLFSGLQTGGAPVAATAPVAASAPAPVASNSMVDMFGGLSLQSSAPVMAASAAPAAVAAPASLQTASSSSSLILDPLLEPVSVAQTVNRNLGMGGMPANMNMGMNVGMGGMNMNSMGMMNSYAPQQQQQQQQQQQMQMQQMQQMQYMQQMQQMQYMQQMQQGQMQQGQMPVGMGMGSQVIGAAMTPSGYIAKTIHEPTDEVATSDSGFNFMKKKDDSFNFIKDAMKNS